MINDKQIRQLENVVPRRSICVFALLLRPPKNICEQNVEKTSSKIERELCTIEMQCHESLYCKINT